MAKVKFTAGRIAAFRCEEGKAQSFLWCDTVPGLAVRATAGSTAKRYIFQAKVIGQTMRLTIGPVSAWGIDAAQAEARRLQILIDQGEDPRQVKADKAAAKEAEMLAKETEAIELTKQQTRASITVGEVWKVYIEARRTKWGERTLFDHLKVIKPERTKGEGSKVRTLTAAVLSSLMPLPLSALTAERVKQWLEEEAPKRPTQAALAFRLLRAFINWCEDRPEYKGIAHADACASKSVRENVPKASAKDDALQREQLRIWFEAVGRVSNRKAATYLQGMLITGARPNELASLRWADVDFQWSSLIIHDKVEGERTIPLTPYLASLLRSLKVKNETPPAKYRILHGRKIQNDLEGWKPSAFVFGSDRSVSGQIENAGLIHRKMLASVGIPNVTLHGLRRSFGSLSEWCECPVGVVAQIQGHKPSATAEKHYRVRPLDLLRMWHTRIEAWMLEQAGIELPSEEAKPGLKRVN